MKEDKSPRTGRPESETPGGGAPAPDDPPTRGGPAADPAAEFAEREERTEREEREAPAAGARTRTVRDRRAAELLADPDTLRQLEPFLGRPCSVSEAARRSGASPNTTLRRVQRFVDAGLLEVARELPRAGRAIKLYRTVAEVFFVPFEATPAESLEAALAERDAYHERQLRRGVVRARLDAIGVWGTRIYRDAEGRLQVQTALGPDANATTLDDQGPAALSAWRDRVRLDFEDAKRLQRELFALLLRYQRLGAETGGAQRYVVRVAMAPVPGER